MWRADESRTKVEMETDNILENASSSSEFSDQWCELFKNKPFCPKKITFSSKDDFFQEGNLMCNFHMKQLSLDIDHEDLLHDSVPEFVCRESSCQAKFTSVITFENHYRSNHYHICSECKRPFPSDHLLNLHLQEEHDAYFKAKVEQGDKCIYNCAVQDCNKKFTCCTLRHQHLVKDHKYPADFRFTRPKKEKCIEENSEDKMTVEDSFAKSPNMVDKRGEMKGPSPRIPRNICFGHGSVRAFHHGSTKSQTYGKKKFPPKKTKHTVKDTISENKQDICMEELQRALDNP